MASALNVARVSIAAALLSTAMLAAAEAPPALKPYISEDSPVIVLMHVRVIDGTGSPPAEDQRIDIEAGKITRLQSAKLRNAFPPNAKSFGSERKERHSGSGRHARASVLHGA